LCLSKVPIERHDNAVVAKLPEPKTIVPREKPVRFEFDFFMKSKMKFFSSASQTKTVDKMAEICSEQGYCQTKEEQIRLG